MDIVAITIKLMTGLISLFVITKLLGKGKLTDITAFDFISVIILGEILGNIVFNPTMNLLYVSYILFLWGLFIFFSEWIYRKYQKSTKTLDNQPHIVINRGKIDIDQLKKNDMDMSQLQRLLRQKGIFSIREVEYAFLEFDGRISVLKRFNYGAPIKKDFNIPLNAVNIPVIFIMEGMVLWDNLKNMGFDENWLRLQLSANGIERFEDVFYAEWLDGDGIYVVPLK